MTTNPHYIVAIGASAGGLEALSSFFDHTPLDGVSYIIIPHLSADFKSQMVHILSRHSILEVLEASEGMIVEVNKVYLIPNTKYMGIKDGRLYLMEKVGRTTPHMTIDGFFTSLAEERGHKSIGVILSGVGTDGSRGIHAIHKAGGFILVQDPSDAKFDGMPNAAIASTDTKYILAAEAIPLAIEQYVHDDQIITSAEEEASPLDGDFLTSVINVIKEHLPFDFTDYKIATLVRRIRRRMVHHNFTDEKHYHFYLKKNPLEAELLTNDFLIGVTSFFRDPEAFRVVEEEVIPDIIESNESPVGLKVWVACCATGEEAYSIAILIKESLIKSGKSVDVKIFATDINKAALEYAAKGIYTEEIVKHITAERLNNFFDEGDGFYRIKPEIRKMLIFAQHDLAKNPPYCNVDLISCRNMLIYIKPVLQSQILSKFSFGLKKNGYLFLGSSENISPVKANFDEINAKWKIFRSIQTGSSSSVKGSLTTVISGIIPGILDRPTVSKRPISNTPYTTDLIETAFSESDFCGVSIDEDFKVTQTFGDPSPYLKQKLFNLNFQELLPESLSIAFSAAVHKASNAKHRVKINKIQYTEPGTSKVRNTDLIILPFQDKKINKSGMLVLFNSKNEQNQNSIEEDFHIDSHIKEHIAYLEEELLQARQELETSNEFLESSKESMQSFNEELLSANEEMQSANEELQSMNEELQTINNEHQSTIAELSELNDDLNNYFRSNINGQLFVDKDLLLKKYSPGAVKHINIRDRDIGRPLSNITTNIRFESLIEDIKTVIVTGEVVIQEVESLEGKIYQVMTSPYIRQSENVTDGAIITFYDITELKKIQRELDSSNKSLLRINADLDNFVYAASHDLTAPINNIESVLGILYKKMDMSDPVVEKFTGIIANSIRNFKTVIKDMTVIGSIEAEMRKENPPQFFEEIFNEIRLSILDEINAANSTFSVDFQEREIKFPKKNLRSILLNLITNALKYKAPERDAEILIRTEKYKECILLTVRDNGLGIENSRLDSIFNMYQRINHDTEGQGIGLYLIRKIVDASGGKVEVESEIGRGTTFKIYFKI